MSSVSSSFQFELERESRFCEHKNVTVLIALEPALSLRLWYNKVLNFIVSDYPSYLLQEKNVRNELKFIE